VTVSAVRENCTELGVTADDIGAIVDLFIKAQTGDRLHPVERAAPVAGAFGSWISEYLRLFSRRNRDGSSMAKAG
jgi:hypothetical protein